VALGTLAVAYGSIVIAACSDDDTVAGNNPSTEGPADGTLDASGDNAHPSIDTGTPDTNQKDTSIDTNKPLGDCVGAIDAASLDDAEVQQGLATVLAFKCYNCHQSTPLDAGLVLSGRNTSLVPDGAVYPPNLTPDPDSGLGCWTLDQIQYTILNAIDDQDASLCVMPKFSTRGMDASAAQAVANYLKSLPAVQNQVPETTCPTSPPDSGSGDASDAGAADAADADDAPADG